MSRTGAATSAARRVRAGRRPVGRRPHTGATGRFRPPPGGSVPRRYSGAARGTRRAGAARLPDRARRALRAVAGLPDLAIVDRVVRGRAWIAVVGALLIGVVALQVAMLKLNAGIGRAVERTAALERDKARLEASMAGASSAERIRAKASRLGLVTPSGRVRYVSARGPAPARAAAAALAAGRFQPPQSDSQGPVAPNDSSASPAAGGSTDASSTTASSTTALTPSEAQAMLNDGDPSNDAQALLNDGDPSNDAQAMLNDGNPSNDGQALAQQSSSGGDAQAAGG